MYVYGQLRVAQFENLSVNPGAGVGGRFWWHTTNLQAYLDDGTNIRAFLRNDQKIILGSSGTANDNLRLNRAAAGVLQLVLGGDTTAEGALSTSIGQLGYRAENFAFAGRPAVGNAGRVIYVTDRSTLQVDTGAAWIPVGSGGGGGSLQWVEDDEAPLSAVENKIQIYQFQNGLAQKLYALVKVPAGYVTGSQIRMRMNFYSPGSSNTALMRTVSTLIRVGTDLITSTANQRTSTNAAVTLTGGTVDIPQSLVLDLTDASGQINAVAVSPGDLIIVQLFRDTDTSTDDIRVPVYGAEVSFS